MASWDLRRLGQAAGWPLIERDLGERPLRGVALSLLLTVGWVIANILYYLYLLFLSGSPYSYISSSEQAFLELGWESFAGSLGLQAAVFLSVVWLLMAPAMACMSALKEARERTLEALLLSPLSPRSLHRGLGLGSLARLGLWLVGPLAVLAVVALTGGIGVGTALSVLALLVVGGWGLSSLGVMVGLLFKDASGKGMSNAPMVALAFFVGLLVLGTLPVSLVMDGEGLASLLSPSAALFNALMTDGNAWLRGLDGSPEAVYTARLFGMEVNPLWWALALAGVLGALGEHVGRRRLAEPLAPPLSTRAAALTMGAATVWLSVFGAELLPMIKPEMVGEELWVGRAVLVSMAVTNLLGLPLALLLSLGALAQAPWVERVALRPASRRGRLGEGWLVPALALLPLAATALVPLVSSWLPSSSWWVPWERLSALLPYGWGLLGLAALLEIWRLGPRQHRHHLLALVGGGALLAAGFLCVILTLERGIPDLGDVLRTQDVFTGGFLMGLMSFFALSPPLFVARALWWRRQTAARLEALRIAAAPKPEAPQEPFAWPAAREPRDQEERLCLLHPSPHPPGERAQDGWLALRGSSLSMWRGPSQSEAVEVALERPFAVAVTLQPRESFSHGHARLNVTVSQRQGEGWARVSFGVRARYAGALEELAVQDQRVEALRATDVEAVLGALRFFAQAQGVALPLEGARGAQAVLPRAEAPPAEAPAQAEVAVEAARGVTAKA